ncbi:MAG: hypothetical protein OXK77_00040 [Gemmatimonadota bacterium]|nr:hypothetical protein [Gemmatimonadota bacterium]MDE2865298.1 hypothetical protein [Gemmatimonadota bacterium]
MSFSSPLVVPEASLRKHFTWIQETLGARVGGSEAGGTGDPHWHFDAVESLTRDDARERAAEYLSILKIEEEETEAQDFSPQSVEPGDVRDLVSMQELSRMHFPSAAAWWKGTAMDSHVHSPGSVTEIQIWVDRTLKYVVRELARLQA